MAQKKRWRILALGVLALSCTSFPQATQSCHAQSFHRAAGATAPSPSAGSMFVYPERIPLKEGGFFTATRGQMFVPLNRNKAESDVISVEFYRFPRSEKASPDTPPLFMLRGGPGFEGLQDLLGKAGEFEKNLQGYLDMTDLVVVGQRGIGSSKPDTLVKQPRPPVLNKADDPKAVAAFQDVLKAERQFWLDQGLDLSGFNAVQAATDIKDIANGLGYDKIIISGGSFGSHWGMTLMRQHPEVVARAILHGMEGPDHTWDHPGWSWDTYKRVAELAEKSDRLVEFIPEGGLIKAVEAMVANAEANPITVTLNPGKNAEQEVVIDGSVMRFLARGYRRSLRSWPAEVIQMHNGNFQDAARRVNMMSRITGTGTSTASFWMLDSSSGISAKRRAEFESDPAMKIIGSTFDYYRMGSPLWDADLGDDFRQNFKTKIPTVIVQGTWDEQTPYGNAVELAPYFENGTFVTVHRGSHGALREALSFDENFRTALEKFTLTGDRSGLPASITLDEPRWKVPDLN